MERRRREGKDNLLETANVPLPPTQLDLPASALPGSQISLGLSSAREPEDFTVAASPASSSTGKRSSFLKPPHALPTPDPLPPVPRYGTSKPIQGHPAWDLQPQLQ